MNASGGAVHPAMARPALVLAYLPAEVLGELLVACKGHRNRAERNGKALPSAFADLEQLLRMSVSGSQRPSMLPVTGQATEPEHVNHRCVSYEQAAALLSVSESTLTRLVRSGDLPTVSIGHAARVRFSDLAAFIEALPARRARP